MVSHGGGEVPRELALQHRFEFSGEVAAMTAGIRCTHEETVQCSSQVVRGYRKLNKSLGCVFGDSTEKPVD